MVADNLGEVLNFNMLNFKKHIVMFVKYEMVLFFYILQHVQTFHFERRHSQSEWV